MFSFTPISDKSDRVLRTPLPPVPPRTSPLTKWAGHRGPILSAEKYAVRNRGGCVSFLAWYMEDPPAQGTFKFVTYGSYTSGPRKGDICVGKWLKRTESSCRHYYDSQGRFAFVIDRSLKEDVRLAQVALSIVAAFNRSVCEKIGYSKTVMLTIPDVWRIKKCKIEHWSGTEILIEPLILDYTKFNSNNGWSCRKTEDALLMQALSHFSYHYTGGEILLCDLQGGYENSNIILTDPALLSPSAQFGPSDLGKKGIKEFFKYHKCTKYCSSEWITPFTNKGSC